MFQVAPNIGLQIMLVRIFTTPNQFSNYMALSLIQEFLRQYFLVILAGMILSIPVHEGAHWVAARVFTEDLAFKRDGFEPNLQLYSPNEVPNWGIQLMGIFPAVVGLCIVCLTVIITSPWTELTDWSMFLMILGGTTSAGSLFSGGDWLAVFAPKDFKKYAAESTYETPNFRDVVDQVLR